jgi:drug/metabolite transporter (DMT)-like permease
VELLFVFGYLGAITRCRGVRWREWAAAIAMSAGLAVFLRAASPSAGRPHAPGTLWWIAGLATLAAAGTAVAAGSGAHVTASRRAACLGIATGIAWGFVAAVIKEMSSHLDGGLAAVFTNWAVYVLVAAGAAATLLASHAMTAGPLAASQPGFTLLDPAVAILLGVFLFGERLQAAPADLAGEIFGLLVLAAGVWALSRSQLVSSHGPALPPRTLANVKHRELLRKTR